MANLADMGAEIDGTMLHLIFDRDNMVDHYIDATSPAALIHDGPYFTNQ